jgi:hypothetical protein
MKHFQDASWNAYKKIQLLRQENNPSQVLPNYRVELIKSLDEYPKLSSDLSNIIFVQSNQKKNNLL